MKAKPVVVHLDESCLGNGREGDNPGGYGGLIEVRTASGIQRRDIYGYAPATTNNRMALTSAIAALEVLSGKGARLPVLIVSDSEYLVKGIREWVPGWKRRSWTRKGGPIENLPLWQSLSSAAAAHDVQWTWVRGHRGHPKNEYVNDLAVAAARERKQADGAIPSELATWLSAKRAKGMFAEYDPDAAFGALEQRLVAAERVPLRLPL